MQLAEAFFWLVMGAVLFDFFTNTRNHSGPPAVENETPEPSSYGRVITGCPTCGEIFKEGQNRTTHACLRQKELADLLDNFTNTFCQGCGTRVKPGNSHCWRCADDVLDDLLNKHR
jgi:hypothetical protein